MANPNPNPSPNSKPNPKPNPDPNPDPNPSQAERRFGARGLGLLVNNVATLGLGWVRVRGRVRVRLVLPPP